MVLIVIYCSESGIVSSRTVPLYLSEGCLLKVGVCFVFEERKNTPYWLI